MPGINNGYAVCILTIAVRDRQQQEKNNDENACHLFRKLSSQGIQFFNAIKLPDSRQPVTAMISEGVRNVLH